MILQALYSYYQRLASVPERNIAPEGFEWKEIPFVIAIDENGRFRSLEDTREGEGRSRRAHRFLVPQARKRTGNIKPNLLWDNVEYALGANPRNRGDVQERHAAFKRHLGEQVGHLSGQPPVKAVIGFLESDPVRQIVSQPEYGIIWKELFEGNQNLTFKLDGDPNPSIPEAIHPHLLDIVKGEKGPDGFCLVTGHKDEIARLHPPIKGVRGSNTSGAAVVSFNLPAFESFGRSQNFNAPVGQKAAFAYTTAMNRLLEKDSQNKTGVADTTILFWSEKESQRNEYDLEKDFSWFFADPPKDDPDRGIRAVRALYEAVYSGKMPKDEGIRFNILGLAPNAARIAIRFWRTGPVGQFGDRILRHFNDLDIGRGKKNPEFLPLNHILRATALEFKIGNVPPNLPGAVVEAILDGTPYPATLFHQCLRRIRAERNVNRTRAAIVKACINRSIRFRNPLEKEELTVSLDRANQSPGYRLGRLFAVLEKIQEEASPGINATIRDRFYGAASSNPVAVFPQLLKLKNHHLGKIENPGRKVNLEKQLGEIFSGLVDFPSHLPMEEQGRFAIGYYHQRQAFFEKTPQQDESKSATQGREQ